MIVGLLGLAIPARAWARVNEDGPVAEGPAAAVHTPESLSVSMTPFFISLAVAALSLGVLWRLDVIRPGSFSRRPARRADGVPWFIWLAAAVVVFMAAQLGAAAGLMGLGPASAAGGVEVVRRGAIMHAASYTAALATAGFMLHALRDAADGLRMRLSGVWVGFAAFLLAYPVIYAVTSLAVLVATWVKGAPLPVVAHESLRQILEHRDSPWAWLMAAGAVIGAPVIEEIMYRVFLQTALLRLYGRAWPAIFTTAALFAAVHIGVAEKHALPVLLVLGLAMGIAYERARTPVVPIVMHAAFNLLNVVLALWLK